MSGDGKPEAEVWKRIQVGTNAWRRVEGVMANRNRSRKLKGKVLVSCGTPAYLCGLETMELTDNNSYCRSARTTGSGGLRE